MYIVSEWTEKKRDYAIVMICKFKKYNYVYITHVLYNEKEKTKKKTRKMLIYNKNLSTHKYIYI